MKKFMKSFVVIGIILFLFLILYAGYSENYNVQYYERFETKEGKISFINELTPNDILGKWHIKVYKDGSDDVVKFEVINQNNKIFQVVTF